VRLDDAKWRRSRASRKTTYQPGQAGFIRRVFGTGEPVWIVDVAPRKLLPEKRRPRRLRSAFALPIRLGNQFSARRVLSRDEQQPGEWLLKTGAAWGSRSGISWREASRARAA